MQRTQEANLDWQSFPNAFIHIGENGETMYAYDAYPSDTDFSDLA